MLYQRFEECSQKDRALKKNYSKAFKKALKGIFLSRFPIRRPLKGTNEKVSKFSPTLFLNKKAFKKIGSLYKGLSKAYRKP